MASIGALALQFLSKYLFQILIGLAIIIGYFAWEHHVQSLQKAKDDAETERATKDLLQRKMVEIKIANDDLNRRKDNAIKIYAQDMSRINDSARVITERVQHCPKSGSGNSLPRGVQNRQEAEGVTNSENREVSVPAPEAIELAAILAECKSLILPIPTKN